MKNKIETLKKNKTLLIIFVALFVFIPIILLIFKGATTIKNPYDQQPSITLTTSPKQSSTPSLTPSSQSIQQPFHIINTTPKNLEQNVYAGEIIISFSTDVDIISPDQLTLSISPQLPNYWRITNTYPTKTIQAQVYGGLLTNTKYTVTVKNENQTPVYSWSFTTSQQAPDSSSGLIKDTEEQIIKNYYPLFDYIPYSSNNFDITYTARLTLSVTIKNPDVNTVKQEVQNWIKSHGVNPTTHTINYTNAF